MERSVAELKALLAAAEREIERLNETIGGLEDEVELLKGLPPEKRIAANNNNNSNSNSSTIPTTTTNETSNLTDNEIANLPNVVKLQEHVKDLEDKISKLQEEKQQLADLCDELKDKVKITNK